MRYTAFLSREKLTVVDLDLPDVDLVHQGEGPRLQEGDLHHPGGVQHVDPDLRTDPLLQPQGKNNFPLFYNTFKNNLQDSKFF